MSIMVRAVVLGGLLMALSFGVLSEELWTVGFAVSTPDGTVLFATQASYTLTEEGFQSAGDFAVSRGPAYIKMTEPLPRRLLLSNATPQEQEFLLLEFVDTTAVEFALDERKGRSHRLELAAGEEVSFSTELPLVKDGLHNLFLVCLYRLRGPGAELATHLRAYVESLFVGEGRAPQHTAARPGTFLEGHRGNRLRRELPKGGLLISLERTPEAGDFLTELETSSGEELRYYIHMRNGRTGQPATEFAIIAVLDGKQIPVSGDPEDPAVSVRLEPGAEITVPAKLTAPEESGEHELWLLALEEPYTRKGSFPGPGLRYSLRVRLVVR